MAKNGERIDHVHYPLYIDTIPRLNEALRGQFWTGSNISTVGDHLIKPRGLEIVTVGVGRDHFPDLTISAGLTGAFQASTRSRHAQFGLHVYGFFDGYEASGRIGQDKWLEIHGQERTSLPVLVQNLSQRPIRLLHGTELFRLFYKYAAEVIKGESLRSALNSGEIGIDGEENEDWVLIEDGGNPVAVEIKINKILGWIPPDEKGFPIKIDGNTSDYRQIIDSLLKPIPDSDKPVLMIGETPRVRLPDNVFAEICPFIIGNSDLHTSGRGGVHSFSTLIDEGSDWPIRLEFLSVTYPESEIPRSVTFAFRRSSM